MKVHRRSRDIAPLILNQSTRCELTSRSGRFNLVKEPLYPLNGRLGGFQSRSDRFGENKMFFPALGFEHRTHLVTIPTELSRFPRVKKINTNLKSHTFTANKAQYNSVPFLYIILIQKVFKLYLRIQHR